MATTINVTGRRDAFSPSKDRVGKLDRMVFYQVNSDVKETFFVMLPVESWTEAAERDAIAKAEAARKLSKPSTFTIP